MGERGSDESIRGDDDVSAAFAIDPSAPVTRQGTIGR